MNQDNGQAGRGTGTGTLPSRPDRASLDGAGHKNTDRNADGALVSEHGRTAIADGVVAKVAGMAAREIGGVHAMGAGIARTFGSVRERLPGGGSDASQGVSVQVGEKQAAIDIDLVVEYGAAIPDLSSAVRDNVMDQVQHMTGLEVVEVNITVDDIHLPGEDDDAGGNDRSGEDKGR
ncbi:Alkaline shock protein 23 [Actinomadura rubteroloni]|uniref:Alkaline shock protein 23 n=1 Tax=Actinomadura rubteroloni TaxID=1926885 RepID=A0A2P4UJE3_9ACTN|nr:Asp23/Gls24 family envelope stress response protein [Actinomadura rubteroloni]POM25128.1 Alkaline shock protein 23 [Actinomadura rubteroloni]